jgi:16S rRNA (adenine1518-N6/adenine1519-N6)-dimethyltransferase
VSPGASADVALLGPAEVRRLVAELGIRPKKQLGQNFMHDANTIRRIVATAQLRADDTVLEIGPGLGSLTLALLSQAKQVTAVEVDQVLADRLPGTVAARAPGLASRMSVLHADALRVRRGDLPGEQPSVLVANLPYNVAVPVLLHLLDELPSVRRGLVLVQSEVADRLAAQPGSRVYGVPSVKLAWYARARKAGPVPRTVFWPVPNVDSNMLSFTRAEPPTGADRSATFAVVDAAFAQRRKTLRSSLAGWAGSAAQAEAVLRAAGVEPSRRAEQLDLDAFALIAAARDGAAARNGRGRGPTA